MGFRAKRYASATSFEWKLEIEEWTQINQSQWNNVDGLKWGFGSIDQVH